MSGGEGEQDHQLDPTKLDSASVRMSPSPAMLRRCPQELSACLALISGKSGESLEGGGAAKGYGLYMQRNGTSK